MTKLTKINGVGPAYAKRLKSAGVGTVEEFLEKCATASGRQAVAQKSDVSEKQLENWLATAQADFGSAAKPAATKRTEPTPPKKAEKAAPAPAKKAEPKKAEKPAPPTAQKPAPKKAEKAAPAPAKKAEPAKKPKRPTVDPAKEKEAVLGVLDTESQGILSHDLGLLQSIHAPDAVHRDRGGPEWQGWDAISDRYSDIFGHGWESLSLIDPKVEIKGDEATVTHEGVVINDNPTPGQSTYTLKKIDGSWKITSMEYGG